MEAHFGDLVLEDIIVAEIGLMIFPPPHARGAWHIDVCWIEFLAVSIRHLDDHTSNMMSKSKASLYFSTIFFESIQACTNKEERSPRCACHYPNKGHRLAIIEIELHNQSDHMKCVNRDKHRCVYMTRDQYIGARTWEDTTWSIPVD